MLFPPTHWASLAGVFLLQKRRSGRQVKRRKYNEDLDFKVVDDDGETIAVLGAGRTSALSASTLAWQAEVRPLDCTAGLSRTVTSTAWWSCTVALFQSISLITLTAVSVLQVASCWTESLDSCLCLAGPSVIILSQIHLSSFFRYTTLHHLSHYSPAKGLVSFKAVYQPFFPTYCPLPVWSLLVGMLFATCLTWLLFEVDPCPCPNDFFFFD